MMVPIGVKKLPAIMPTMLPTMPAFPAPAFLELTAGRILSSMVTGILLGRGVNVPMVVIFVGAIGGFLASGIIGLFVGSVILALGYKLFMAWLAEDPRSALEEGKSRRASAGARKSKKDQPA